MRRALAGLVAAAALADGAAAEGSRSRLAEGKGAASAPVQGPVSVKLRVGTASIEVLPSDKAEVRVEVKDRPALLIALFAAGAERIELEFDGRSRLQQGALRLWVPKKSRLELASLEGAIAVRGIGGEVRVRGMSGDVDVLGAAQVDVESIDGEVDVLDATGPVAVRTISGNVTVSSASTAPRFDAETESGNIEWRGACAQGCHLDADTVSGQLRFTLDPKASSFEVRFMSQSGKLHDALGARAEPAKEARKGPAWSAATFGAGAGEIECESFSGNLSLQPR